MCFCMAALVLRGMPFFTAPKVRSWTALFFAVSCFFDHIFFHVSLGSCFLFLPTRSHTLFYIARPFFRSPHPSDLDSIYLTSILYIFTTVQSLCSGIVSKFLVCFLQFQYCHFCLFILRHRHAMWYTIFIEKQRQKIVYVVTSEQRKTRRC
jgi:hypothetical protein